MRDADYIAMRLKEARTGRRRQGFDWRAIIPRLAGRTTRRR